MAMVLAELGHRARGLRTGQATAVAVSQCRRSRTAEINCESSTRTQGKGAVANSVLAAPCDLLVASGGVPCTTAYPQHCSAVHTHRRGDAKPDWQNDNGIVFWRWQVGMEMEIAMAGGDILI